MSTDAIGILREIAATLLRIEAQLSAPAAKRKRNGRATRERGLVIQGRADGVSDRMIQSVLSLWKELCPSCPQPVALTDERKLEIEGFWTRFKDRDGVRNVFLTVAGNDWLCGRMVKGPRGPYSRHSAIGLFELIRNLPEVLEGTYK